MAPVNEIDIAWRSILIVIPAGLAIILTCFLYRRRFLGTGWGAMLWFGAWGSAAAVVADRLGVFTGVRRGYFGEPSSTIRGLLSAICAGLLIVFAVPFVARIYAKWIGSSIDEHEKAPGAEGVRAWLNGWNLVLAGLIALCAWQGFDYSFWGVLALAVGLLLAYPAAKAMSAGGQSPQPAATPGADLSDERERVLKLLEDGKITAEEGSELLGALGETARPAPPPPPAAMSAGSKLLLLGALLVIVGFFLPWFSIDLGQEMARVGRMLPEFENHMSRSVGAPPMFSGGAPVILSEGSPMPVGFSGTVRVSGGDIAHGFGWIILLLGVLVAALQFVKLNVSRQAQKMLLLGPLAVGAFLFVYLLTDNIRYVSFGLPLVMAGYVIEFVGLVKDFRAGA